MNEYFSALIDQENLSIRFDVIHAPLLKYFQYPFQFNYSRPITSFLRSVIGSSK